MSQIGFEILQYRELATRHREICMTFKHEEEDKKLHKEMAEMRFRLMTHLRPRHPKAWLIRLALAIHKYFEFHEGSYDPVAGSYKRSQEDCLAEAIIEYAKLRRAGHAGHARHALVKRHLRLG